MPKRPLFLPEGGVHLPPRLTPSIGRSSGVMEPPARLQVTLEQTRKEEVSRGAIWDFDPAELADKPLAVLNAMIIARDPSIPPCKTKRDAIEVLSKQWPGHRKS